MEIYNFWWELFDTQNNENHFVVWIFEIDVGNALKMAQKAFEKQTQ